MMMRSIFAVALGCTLLPLSNTFATKYWAYFGCIEKEEAGIYVAEFDSESGKLSDPRKLISTEASSFLTIAPDGASLYAVQKDPEGEPGKNGALGSYAIDTTTGDLTLLNTVSIESPGACHVALTPTGTTAAIADYGAGIVSSFGVNEDGSLTELVSQIQHEGSSINEKRQKGPHAHCVTPSLDGKFVFSADLGTDHVYSYAVGEGGALTPNADNPSHKVKPGGGPRHMSFHPSHMFAYVNNELTSSVNALRYTQDTGKLEHLQIISTLPEDFEGEKNSTSEILCHPTGKWVYVANRGHNSIAALAVDGASGELTSVGQEPCGGEIPRNFGITPDGRWILTCCQESGNTAVLKIDGETGALSLTDEKKDLPKPMCVRFVQATTSEE